MRSSTVGTSAPGVEPSCVMRLIVARPDIVVNTFNLR
jgi:hypothetical protein